MDRVLRVMRKYDNRLLKCKGVIGIDVGKKEVKGVSTDQICIIVFVEKKPPEEDLTEEEAVPAQLEDIPTDVVECLNVWPTTVTESCTEVGLSPPEPEPKPDPKGSVVTDPLVGGVALSPPEPEPKPDPKGSVVTDPLVGGVSIAYISEKNPHNGGTLAIIGNYEGTPTALSCAHVMVEKLPGIGSAIKEPAGTKHPSTEIGKVSALWYGGNTNLDAALAPIEGREAKVGYVANIGQVVQFAAPAVGQKVMKMGAKTGKTESKIVSTSYTSKSKGHLGELVLKNQIRVEPAFAKAGDSGSAVIATVNGKLSVVGILRGGNSKFNACNRATDFPFKDKMTF